MLLLGYDIGSSSIKASVVDAESGRLVATASSPQQEMTIQSPRPGWAEQHPELWWEHVKVVTSSVLSDRRVRAERIKAIGISYQMHGLVVVDEHHKPLRPSIIWCDGRAVDTGNRAFEALGQAYCLEHFLNSPGNFTASKLRWVRDHEPELYKKIYKFMLPGDYIALKLTGEISTTYSGLSEAILWDYRSEDLAYSLLKYYDIAHDLIPDVLPSFADHGSLTKQAAGELGLRPGIRVCYKAGDQPNNAHSLNVLDPGEIAATAGTSGVIYGVTDKAICDSRSRVNTFVHVNHAKNEPRYGVLLCINGTGIQYSWIKNQLLHQSLSYEDMNAKAKKVPVSSDGVVVLPFGNGPERCLDNKSVGGQILGLNFNRHNESHVVRAALEGIAFSFNYGLQIMTSMSMRVDKVRVGLSNMFLSPVFTEAFANVTGLCVERYRTNGSLGAAIGAGIGAELYKNRQEAFSGLEKVDTIEPDRDLEIQYSAAYQRWEEMLNRFLTK